MEENKSSLTLPVAIIAAGAIIAGAIFFTSVKPTDKPLAPNPNAGAGTQTAAVGDLKPIGPDDHILGDPNAPVVAVIYSDTECPFCKDFHDDFAKIMDQYAKSGQLAEVYRHSPIDGLHPKARKEAEATECAFDQGGDTAFWNYLNAIIARKTGANAERAGATPTGIDPSELPTMAGKMGLDKTKFADCLASGKNSAKVQAEYEDSVKAGLQGTPFTVALLKTPASAATQTAIQTSFSQFPPGTIAFSANGDRFTINGALPLAYLQPLFSKILATK